jgi:ankyrin repeat protein
MPTEREIRREHWPAWIAQTNDARVTALRDAPAQFAAVCAGSNVQDRFHFGATLLHAAAMFGRTQAAEFLLQNGANIEAQNKGQWTPLIEAVKYDQIDTADLLIQRGARLQYKTVPILTDEDLAAQREQYRRTFQDASHLGLPMISGALQNPAFVEEMVQQMIDTVTASREEHAISHCHGLEMLQLLVEKYHCSVNVHDGAGYWPLKVFAEAGDCAALEYLLQVGADVDFTSSGETALHAAVQNGAPQCVRILLQAGANPNQQDADGHTPLHGVKDMQTLELLLKAGADPRIGDQIGSRPSSWVKDNSLKTRLHAAERELDARGD